MPLFRTNKKKKAVLVLVSEFHRMNFPRKGKAPDIGSQELADALESCETRRAQYLRCGGMHTEPVVAVVKNLCEGSLRGPGVAYVAPVLYDGIPEFLDKTMDALAELAVYASLYMGLVTAAGMSGFFPRLLRNNVNAYYNGVFASMFCNSAVVLIAVIYRLAAVGHLRDSDKLLYLWRARFVPLFTFILFFFALVCTVITLMYAVADTVEGGQACFAAAGDPTMSWYDWWGEWCGMVRRPIGAGVVHPKGEEILNPWILKANELNIAVPKSFSLSREKRNQYSEFMTDHFGFSGSCAPDQALREHYGGYDHDGLAIMWEWLLPYIIFGLVVPAFGMLLWIAPTRHIFNYWTAQPTPARERYSLGFLGFLSFYLFGPFAHTKIDDPFDMTEAWGEFKLRAAVGLELAKKDTPGDGFVSLNEYIASERKHDHDGEDDHAPADLSALLVTLGLGKKYAAVANEIELEDLRTLARRNDVACLNELEKAGVSVGDRIKITNTLANGL